MPLCHFGAPSSVIGQPTPDSVKLLEHQDNIASKGFTSADYFGMVHTPISMQEVKRNPDALKSLDKEWEKLETIPCWDNSSVQFELSVA